VSTIYTVTVTQTLEKTMTLTLNVPAMQTTVLSPIKIGALVPLTGPYSAWGKKYLEGMKMAVEEINSAGGIFGTKVELVVYDDRNDAKETTAAFEKLATVDKVVAAAGLINSALILAVKPLAEQYRVPLIINLGGSTAIMDLNTRYIFRGCNPNADVIVKATADFIAKSGYKKVAVLIASYEWGFSVRDAALRYISTLPNVQVVVEESQLGATDLTPQLRKIATMQPDVVITYGNPPSAIPATRQGLEMGIKAVYIGAFFPLENWVNSLGELVYENVIEMSCVNRDSSEYTNIATRFYERTNSFMDDSAVWGYVTVYRIVDAIKYTKSTNPEDIANDLRTRKYRHPLLVFPLSYTEYGELSEPKLVFMKFEKGSPGPINPAASWRLKTVHVTSPLSPFIPTPTK